MKTFLCVSLLVIAFSCSFGQKQDIAESKVPETIRKDLLSKFPEARGRTWKTKNGDYEVDFYFKSKKHEVKYNSDGSWKKTSWDIDKKEVPAAVFNSLRASDYASWDVDDIEFVKNKESNSLYWIKVEKGKTTAELLFNASGELIKSEEKQD
jgi:hypothetical protein